MIGAAGKNRGMPAGAQRENTATTSQMKRSFPCMGRVPGGAYPVTSQPIPSTNRVQSAYPCALTALLPVIPSAYGDDDLFQALPTTTIGHAA